MQHFQEAKLDYLRQLIVTPEMVAKKIKAMKENKITRTWELGYKIGDTVLGTTIKEKDLGIAISADMKVSEQCGIAASKGNKIL